jgi:hypothetical protein
LRAWFISRCKSSRRPVAGLVFTILKSSFLLCALASLR